MNRILFQGQVGNFHRVQIPFSFLGYAAVGGMIVCSVVTSGGIDYAELATWWSQCKALLAQHPG